MEGIDLYADVDDFVRDQSENAHDGDLYDDVITSRDDAAEEPPKVPVQTTTASSSIVTGGKRISLYVGNLTWWTTDQDLQDALASIGVTDLINIKFHENRTNGQSKGFATVMVGSENSSRLILEKLSQKDLHGMLPSVLHFTMSSLLKLDPSASKKDAPGAGGGQKAGGMTRGSTATGHSALPPPPLVSQTSPHGARLPGPPPPGVSFGPPHLGPPPPANGGLPGRLPGVPAVRPPLSFAPPPMPGLPPAVLPAPSRREPPPVVISVPPPHRMPVVHPGGPGVIVVDPRLPPPRGAVFRPESFAQPPPTILPPPSVPPPGAVLPVAGHPPAPVQVLPGVLPPPGHPHPVSAPHINPAFAVVSSSTLPSPAGAPPFAADPFGRPPPSSSYPPPLSDNHARRPPPMMERSSGDSYRRSSPDRRESSSSSRLSEAEFEEVLQRNKTVSSSAISRAVQDASSGDYGSAIETLVTAVSLIKQSKIANDDRCRILISSLQDTLHGIELKSYGSKSVSSRERRSRSPRERDPLERTSRSRQQRSRSREHEYHDRAERHVEYVRERSQEREPAMVHERSRYRSRERDPYDRSSREFADRGRVSSDSRRYESDRHRAAEREYSSSRTNRH